MPGDGQWISSYLSTTTLSLILAVIIILAGINTFKASKVKAAPLFSSSIKRQQLLLMAIGGIAGFGSGLAGVGGQCSLCRFWSCAAFRY
ncbi:TSUP family transporter [Noviherbaspirillum sp. Root189]|uniref:TSUP family transporter n=1 Tax=Noviherbaspirillum sp. Root189 TaxID=1736487 RepID=UPI002E10915E